MTEQVNTFVVENTTFKILSIMAACRDTIVYSCVNICNNSKCVVKIVAHDVSGINIKAVREVVALKKFKHEHIVKILDVFVDDVFW